MSPADCEKQGKFWLCTLDFVLLSKHQAGSTARRFLCTSVSSGMMKKRWQQLTALVCIVLLSRFGTAQKLTSKQWLHSHCKAYQEDYAPLVIKFLSRYQGGINVADVLNLKVPPGRSASVADGARPVVYLVNNTLHYADNRMAIREGKGMFSAGFSTYFMPVLKRCSLVHHNQVHISALCHAMYISKTALKQVSHD
jgi:hypothetical protein